MFGGFTKNYCYRKFGLIDWRNVIKVVQ